MNRYKGRHTQKYRFWKSNWGNGVCSVIGECRLELFNKDLDIYIKLFSKVIVSNSIYKSLRYVKQFEVVRTSINIYF